MIQGPLLNNNNFNNVIGEDHLGIRYVSINISDTLQHGITSITPRARYWSFYSWVLYDFIKEKKERTNKNFKKYLKRQEWFFILANIASSEEQNINISNLIGITKGTEIWEENEEMISLRRDYVKNSRGGYGLAYSNVMKILGVTKRAALEKGVEIDRLTTKGKELAKAFECSIKNTEYHKNYKLADKVPRYVLLEYGKTAGLDRLGKSLKEKQLLRSFFLPQNTNDIYSRLRKKSLNYYRYLIKNYDNKKISITTWRSLMYDNIFSNKDYPEHLDLVIKGWEIYHGRQIFTYSLETIWSYILETISREIITQKQLIELIFDHLKVNKIELNQKINTLLNIVPLQVDTRETYLINMKGEKLDVKDRIYNPLLVMLDVYERFKSRKDLEPIHNKLLNEGGNDHISLTFWINTVESYLDASIKDLLLFIINKMIIEQHQKVALNKLISTNNETYHFIKEEGKLYFLAKDEPNYNAFRIKQGASILKDLDLI